MYIVSLFAGSVKSRKSDITRLKCKLPSKNLHIFDKILKKRKKYDKKIVIIIKISHTYCNKEVKVIKCMIIVMRVLNIQCTKKVQIFIEEDLT